MFVVHLAVMWEGYLRQDTPVLLTVAWVVPEGRTALLSRVQLAMLTCTAHGWGW